MVRLSRNRMRSGAALLCVGALCASPLDAKASAFEVVGVGPVSIAEVSARAARATDGSAAFFNPAGLAMGRGVHIDFAPQFSLSTLTAGGQTKELADPLGFVVLGDATLPFTGFLKDRFRVGIALYIPPTSVTHLLILPREEPQFPYFTNRTQRLVVQPALALRLFPWFSVGGGVNVLGGVSGPADVRAGASGSPEPRILMDATRQFAAHAGIRLHLGDRVFLGATYRQEFSVPISVVTKADIGGVGLHANVNLGQGLFDPHAFVIGTAFDLDRLQMEVDCSYSLWSAYKGPGLAISAELPGALLTSSQGPALFRDVVSLRGAASYAFDVGQRSEVLLHGGLGFEPSILKSGSQGIENFADGPKVFGGLGASFAMRGVLPKTLRFSLAAGGTFVLPQTVEKQACQSLPCPPETVAGPDAKNPSENIANPGYPQLESGGQLIHMGFGIGVDL